MQLKTDKCTYFFYILSLDCPSGKAQSKNVVADLLITEGKGWVILDKNRGKGTHMTLVLSC